LYKAQLKLESIVVRKLAGHHHVMNVLLDNSTLKLKYVDGLLAVMSSSHAFIIFIILFILVLDWLVYMMQGA
jgi:hypothetical protein